MQATSMFQRDGVELGGISILTFSQGQSEDMWLDFWCQPERICLHK